ncbi:glycosyltransferase family 4 protein [Salinimicrobium flavum]|uniref:Glycosyltransferase family 4 protein n=1 Tax=Salinimicrobium flavum TaxID=1737065 RepID=A0ABW5ISZ5_9FLAO
MFSGFGQFNYWLIKNLVNNNEEFNLVVNAASRKSLKDFGKDVTYNKYYDLNRYKSFRIRKKYDLWHSLNQNSKIEPFHDQPYLLTFHDVIFMEKDKPEDRNPEKIQLLKEKIDRCDAIAFISEHSRESANQYFNIPPSIFQTVIYNGNPVVPIEEEIPAPKTSFSLKKPFLFCIGQFLEMKNFHSLVGMLHYLEDYQLIIAGNNDKPYGQVVMQEINKFNLEDRVFLAGKISEKEKHYYLKNCSAFVFPSLFEGFGLPPIEAMAYGKPVFLANRTSLPEIGGEYAFYWDDFDPHSMAQVFNKGMAEFEANPEVYTAELKKRGSRFNWDTTAKEYLDLYRQLT